VAKSVARRNYPAEGGADHVVVHLATTAASGQPFSALRWIVDKIKQMQLSLYKNTITLDALFIVFIFR
jgi:hypothetical protein